MMVVQDYLPPANEALAYWLLLVRHLVVLLGV